MENIIQKVEDIEIREEPRVKKSWIQKIHAASFAKRALIGLAIYGSSVLPLISVIWMPVLMLAVLPLIIMNGKALVAAPETFMEGPLLVYLMIVQNVIMCIILGLLFFPEIKAGIDKIKAKPQQLGWIPLMWIGSLIFNVIVIEVVGKFINLPESSNNQETLDMMLENTSVLWMAFPLVFAAPFTEELVFRLILGDGTFRLLTKFFNQDAAKNKHLLLCVLSCIISGSIFGFVHVTTGDYLAVVPYLVMGITWGVAYFISGRNIIMTMGVHMMQNIFALIIMALQLGV